MQLIEIRRNQSHCPGNRQPGDQREMYVGSHSEVSSNPARRRLLRYTRRLACVNKPHIPPSVTAQCLSRHGKCVLE